MNKSLQLREMALTMQANGEWNIIAFKESKNWKELLELAIATTEN